GEGGLPAATAAAQAGGEGDSAPKSEVVFARALRISLRRILTRRPNHVVRGLAGIRSAGELIRVHAGSILNCGSIQPPMAPRMPIGITERAAVSMKNGRGINPTRAGKTGRGPRIHNPGTEVLAS